MVSNWLANFALRQARKWLDRHFVALKAGDMMTADVALLKSEDWDDRRMWIDGMDTWPNLRAKRKALRDREGRLSFDPVIVEVDGVAL